MTTNRISRYDGTNWNPIYDSAASLSAVIAGAGGTNLPVTSTANTLTIAAGTGVTVAGATGPNTVTLSIGQSVATTATPTFASITLSAATGAKLTMSGATSNWLEWNNIGVAAPAFTTRSGGTKLVLYPQVTASSVDYALGIESNTLWSSVPSSAAGFKWYAATTAIATLTGAGALTVTGALSSGNATINGGTSPAMLLGSTWPGGNTYAAITVTGMPTAGYGMLMTTADTYISSGTGSTFIRGTSNSSANQIQLSSTAITTTSGSLSINVNSGQRILVDTAGATSINMGTVGSTLFVTANGIGTLTTTTSRLALKERVTTIATEDAIARIKLMRPVNFYWKQEVIGDGTNDFVPLDMQRGFIAEEMAGVDHSLATWSWVDPENEHRILTTELIDNPLPLEDAVPVMWNMLATIADLVSALQGTLSRIESLEDRLTAAGIQ